MKKFALALVMAMVLAAFGSSAFAADAGTSKSAGDQSASQPATAAKPLPADTVATINGEKITTDTLDLILQQASSQGQPAPGPDAKKAVVEKLIEMNLFAQAGEKAGVKDDPDFKKAMDMMHKQEDLFTKQALAATYLRKKAFEDVKVTPEEIKKYYDQNQEQYKTGEQVKASHILVKTEDEAKAIKARLDKGEAFEAVAKDKSTCPSASRGGDLGWFGKGVMDPDFEKAAFALKEGEVSGPVKTKFGWHIIKITGKKPSSVKTLEEVSPQIEQKLTQDKQKKVYDDTLAQLRKQADIRINDTALSEAQPPAGDNAAPAK
ncbi:MAG: peptidyl-prolyl cis-trans isomerase [Nitrospirota bacterium]